jgi:hypothetical protein
MSHCKKLIRAAGILHQENAEFKMEAEPADNLVDEVNDYLRGRLR